MKEKGIVLLLLSVILFICVPISTLAAEDNVVASGTCGDNLIWELENGTLTISGSGEMDDYATNQPWRNYQWDIESVYIQEGVTSIGEMAFSWCQEIAEVRVPESLTKIGGGAFEFCTGLKTINLPNGITKIGPKAFWGCAGVSEIELPDSLTQIENDTFKGCLSLEKITIPKEVTIIPQQTFASCENLSIYGYADSAAETYAKNNDITFVTLSDENSAGETKRTVEVKISCLGDVEDKIRLEIVSEDVNSFTGFYTVELSGNATECQIELDVGIYSMKISKKNHVNRIYTLSIDEGNVWQKVELQLIGDVTNDGTISARDKKLIYNHMAGTSTLTDYTFLVGDVTNDGVINARDKKSIYNHIAGTAFLWE